MRNIIRRDKGINKTLKQSRISNEYFITISMICILVVLFIIASLFVPKFYLLQNIINLVTNFWFIIVLAIGVTFLMVTGNFDLSVGGIVAMSGVLVFYFSQTYSGARSVLDNGLGLPYGVAVVLALAAALAIGAINAFFVAKLKVSSIIVTLGTMSVARGIAQIVTTGSQRNVNIPDIFGVVGNFLVIGTVKLSVIIMVIVFIVAAIVEKKTVFGRRTYLIGANVTAARLSGVKVEKHVIILYLTSALLAGIVGILMASEYLSGNSNRGMGFEFDTVAVVLLGGTSIAGGFGSVTGTFIGVLIISIVTSAATGLLLRPEWQYILKGLIVFIAIVAQRFALDRRKI